jgi:hypothetical protein
MYPITMSCVRRGKTNQGPVARLDAISQEGSIKAPPGDKAPPTKIEKKQGMVVSSLRVDRYEVSKFLSILFIPTLRPHYDDKTILVTLQAFR